MLRTPSDDFKPVYAGKNAFVRSVRFYGAPIGRLKVVAENAWFAARPSGTEEIYKLYAESFKGEAHLKIIQEEAQLIVDKVLKAAGP